MEVNPRMGSATEQSKMVMAHKMHVILMYLKFNINPPNNVSVINFILTHTFFFPWVYNDGLAFMKSLNSLELTCNMWLTDVPDSNY